MKLLLLAQIFSLVALVGVASVARATDLPELKIWPREVPGETNVAITVRHAGGTAKRTLNERKETTPFNFVSVGEFTFKAGDSGFVEISNGKADGRVVIDGVRWVWLGE